MQLAHPHAHLSNRAKVRAALERKPVFKSVLGNPFELAWPSVPANLQNAALARLVVALENVPHAQKTVQDADISGRPRITEEVRCQTLERPSSHFIVGINAVTRALESQLRATQKRVIVEHHPHNHDQPPPSRIVVVFVCCADVDPPALVAHIPHLVAGCNSPKNAHPIRLVPLPKGSESAVSQILGIHRAAVLAICDGSPLAETVRDAVDAIPIMRAPWLDFSDTQGPQLVPTHIKQLHTTAPRDMRSAREQRSKARAAAKKNTSVSSRPTCRKRRVTLTT